MKLTDYQKKALEYDTHVSLTANAGSGKTAILSKRFVKIVLENDLTLKNIVAITFTEKAAGELYSKILKEINSQLEQETELEKINKLQKLRDQIISANISTIHSFCTGVLREFPAEANIDANFATMNGLEAYELQNQILDKFVNGKLDANDSNIKYLIKILGSKSNFKNQFINLLAKRKNLLLLYEKIYSKPLNEILTFFDFFVKEKFKEFFSDEIDSIILNLKEIISDSDKISNIHIEVSSEIQRYNSTVNFDEKLKFLKSIIEMAFTQKFELRKKLLKEDPENRYAFSKATLKTIYEFSNSYVENGKSENENLIKFSKILIEEFFQFSKHYENEKDKNSLLDFDDLLIKTYELLKDDKVVAELSERFQFVMIDEYQDTDELQYQIFMPILEQLKKGNLFVVGDEKQSIYKFREAEIEVFEKTKRDIENTSGKQASKILPHSFRLSEPIAFFVNYVFETILANPKTIFNEVKFSKLICGKDDNATGEVEILLVEQDSEHELKIEELEKREAELVAKKIMTLLNTEQQLTQLKSTIAVLCRKRAQFKSLENAFLKYQIPFVVVKGTGFYQTQIIRDIFSYISFLLNPKDDISLAAILRSPFFLISDNLLFNISSSKGISLIEKLKTFSTTNKIVENIYNKLNRNILLVNKVAPYNLIEKILLESGYFYIESYCDESEQNILNLKKFMQIVSDYFQQGFKTLNDFSEFLKKSISENITEANAQIIKLNAVQIMTIHNSKGLEFESVFVFGMNRQGNFDEIRKGEIGIDKNFGVLAKLPPKNNFFEKYTTSPILSLFNYYSSKRELAEAKRLLYVALTRAIKNLYLCVSVSTRNKNSFWDLISKITVFDLTKKNISFSGELWKRNSAKNIDEKIKYNLIVPIRREIAGGNILHKIPVNNISKKDLTIEIKDFPKREIISATKIAVFNQCPTKYQLTYELGFNKLLNLFEDENNLLQFEFSNKEHDLLASNLEGKDIYIPGRMFGSLVHKILEENISLSELQLKLPILIKKMHSWNYDILMLNKLMSKLNSMLNVYYKSINFNELNAIGKYYNEYEIYAGEGEYYLFGIIDKLLFKDDRILIVDFKTDDIGEDELQQRFENYKTQLDFYAYILNKIYGDKLKIEIRIIFLHFPNRVFKSIFSKSDSQKIKDLLNTYIVAIRNDVYSKNLSHCRQCKFYISNDCIKKDKKKFPGGNK